MLHTSIDYDYYLDRLQATEIGLLFTNLHNNRHLSDLWIVIFSCRVLSQFEKISSKRIGFIVEKVVLLVGGIFQFHGRNLSIFVRE